METLAPTGLIKENSISKCGTLKFKFFLEEFYIDFTLKSSKLCLLLFLSTPVKPTL